MASSRDIRAGRAFVELYSKNNALYKGLQSARQRLDRFASFALGMGRRLSGAALFGGALFAYPVKAASDMQEVMNKFGVVFGENADTVKVWADDAAKAFGRSKRQMAEFMANTQDLFVPLGFAADSATELSKEVTGLAMDLASFNNRADADVMRDLHAALTGSGMVMKKYGVILTETAVKQEMLNQGLDPSAATNQQKVQARLNIIMAGTTAAQGDAIRSGGSFANQMKAVRGILEDVAATIGAAILPGVTKAVTLFGEWAVKAGAFIEKNAGLIRGAAMLVLILGGAGIAFTVLGGAASVLAMILGGLASIIPLIGTALGAVAAVVGFLLSPLGLLIALVVGLGGYLLWASGAGSNALDWLKDKFAEFAAVAMEAFGGVRDAMAAGDMALAAKILWLAVNAQWQKGIGVLKGYWLDFSEYFRNVWTDVTSGFASVFVDMVATLKAAWTGFATSAADQWKQAEKTIAKGVGWIIAKVNGLDPDEMAATLDDMYGQEKAGRDRAAAQKMTQIEADRVASQKSLTDEYGAKKAAIKGDTKASRKAIQDKIADAETAYRGALADAADAAGAAGGGGPAGAKGPATPKLALPGVNLPAAAASAGATLAGAGSLAAYQAIAGSRKDPLLKVQQDANEILDVIAENTANMADMEEVELPR